LLTLKQQQAGVIEAREAVKNAAETLKQGQSIMLFTVVTLIFVSFWRLGVLSSKALSNETASLVLFRNPLWHELGRV
jgi:hypothetical protein